MEDLLLVPSITTHNKRGSTWREKIVEIPSLGLRNVGLFVTGLHKAERKECYCSLLDLRERYTFSIPFVHAVSDMDDAEYALLRRDFGTLWFNLHPLREFPLLCSLSDETRQFITIENSCFVDPVTSDDLDGFAGLCIDLSHLEDARLSDQSVHKRIVDLCCQYPVLANHISAIAHPSSKVHRGRPQHSTHHLESAREMEYLSYAPQHCVAQVAALELENSLEQQVVILERVKSMLLAPKHLSHSLAA